MAKFEIPKLKWLFQDENGVVQVCTIKPTAVGYVWRRGGEYISVTVGKTNTNWRNTLIDLETDDYDFENGILRRIEK